jgi:hypothetical protein
VDQYTGQAQGGVYGPLPFVFYDYDVKDTILSSSPETIIDSREVLRALHEDAVTRQMLQNVLQEYEIALMRR